MKTVFSICLLFCFGWATAQPTGGTITVKKPFSKKPFIGTWEVVFCCSAVTSSPPPEINWENFEDSPFFSTDTILELRANDTYFTNFTEKTGSFLMSGAVKYPNTKDYLMQLDDVEYTIAEAGNDELYITRTYVQEGDDKYLSASWKLRRMKLDP
jgi:hypothetical protein